MKILIAALLFTFASCASNDKDPKNPFDPLTLETALKKGKTTQAEILTTFGSPNETAKNADGTEVWDYSRHSAQDRDTGVHADLWDYFTFPYVSGIGASTRGSKSSSKSMDLVLRFDSNKILADYHILKTSY